MAYLEPSPVCDLLERLKSQDGKDLIRELNIAQIFGNYSDDDISKAITLRYPHISSVIGADDVGSILNYLKDNHESGSNDYARLKKVAAHNKYGKGIPEVQDALKEWDVDINWAKRKGHSGLQYLQVSHMDYNEVPLTYS